MGGGRGREVGRRGVGFEDEDKSDKRVAGSTVSPKPVPGSLGLGPDQPGPLGWTQ